MSGRMAQDQTVKKDAGDLDLIAEFRRAADKTDFDDPNVALPPIATPVAHPGSPQAAALREASLQSQSPPQAAGLPALPSLPPGVVDALTGGGTAVRSEAVTTATNSFPLPEPSTPAPTRLPPALPMPRAGQSEPVLSPPALVAAVPPGLSHGLPPSAPPPLPDAANLSAGKSPSLSPPAGPPAAALDEEPADAAAGTRSERRTARRRAALPSRDQIAANDDAPSIGGLLYALNQKPSRRPFTVAAFTSGVWCVATLAFAGYYWGNELVAGAGIQAFLGRPEMLTLVATILGPIGLMFALAVIAYRVEEMRLRSSAMTEVAVRLAEPDRMAEQQVASLGQAVRRQVTFMNDAVARAIGRAGELEAIVHNEVAALERSYADNEQKIRSLISELSGERNALFTTSEKVAGTLRSLGSDVPALIETLSAQQIKLAKVIEASSQNLTALESAIATQAGNLDAAVNERTQRLHTVLAEYTEALSGSLDSRMELIGTTIASRTGDLQLVFEEYTRALDTTLVNRADSFDAQLTEHTAALDRSFADRSRQLGTQLDERVAQMDERLTQQASTFLERTETLAERTKSISLELIERTEAIGGDLTHRAETIAAQFTERTQAVATELAERAGAMDRQLLERTHALDEAFSERLRLFDDAILRSTHAIDQSVDEKTRALTEALDHHAKSLGETLSRQSMELDESLLQGINAVRRTSESITKQSIKALEGLAGQSELLKSVSENLLTQINAITNRFDNQSQQIIRAANAMETANYKIDKTLQTRHAELSQTLDRMSGKADELSQAAVGYQRQIEGSLNQTLDRMSGKAAELTQAAQGVTRQIEGTVSEADARTRALTSELAQTAEERTRATIADIERLRSTAADTTTKALDDLRSRFSNVSSEVSTGLSSLTSHVTDLAGEARRRAAEAAAELERENERLRREAQALPDTTRESADAMRRVLGDHLRAIDELSSLSRREAGGRDVTRPLPAPPSPAPARQLIPVPGSSPSAGPVPPAPSPTQPREDQARVLTSLTTALSQELQGRPRTTVSAPPSAPAIPAAMASAATSPAGSAAPPAGAEMRDGWKLGDLLKRASIDDEAAHQQAARQQAGQQAAAERGGLDFSVAARALDPAAAAMIWQRLGAGQRGIMVRSIYTPEGRTLFDETVARLQSDRAFADTTFQYLADFERVLQEADRSDPSGETAQSHLRSDYGRVYLFLAHATGRIT
jgi:hypothetical protein